MKEYRHVHDAVLQILLRARAVMLKMKTDRVYMQRDAIQRCKDARCKFLDC